MVADDAKVILVTGSSRGLGKSIALDLGSHGQKVVVNYISDGSKDTALETVEAIKKSGGDAIAVQADSTYNKNSYKSQRGAASTRHFACRTFEIGPTTHLSPSFNPFLLFLPLLSLLIRRVKPHHNNISQLPIL